MNSDASQSVRESGANGITRREIFASLSALMLMPLRAIADDPWKPPAKSLLPIQVSTLNHVRLTVKDIPSTLKWYQKVFGMPVMYRQNDKSPILKIGKGPEHLALVQGPLTPATPPGSPPPNRAGMTVPPHLCWGVKDFHVDRLMRALAEMGMPTGRTVFREGRTPEMNFEDPDGFPLELIDVTGCGGGGYLANQCDLAAVAPREAGDPPPIPVNTLNHVRFMVSNAKASLAWYQKLTDMKIMTYQEPENGPRTAGYEGPPIPILRIGTGPQHLALGEGTVPLRNRPHVGLGIENFDLEQTKKRLDAHGVKWTVRIREGVTPELFVDAPDGVELQLQDVTYCGGGGALGNVCDPRKRLPPATRSTPGTRLM